MQRGRGQNKPRGKNVGPPVFDLRDKLNRMRLNSDGEQPQRRSDEFRGQRGRGPPPDPHYNYLRDPMRESDYDEMQFPRENIGRGRFLEQEHSWRGRGARGGRGGFNYQPTGQRGRGGRGYDNPGHRGRRPGYSYTTDSIYKPSYDDRPFGHTRGRSRGGQRGAYLRSKSADGRLRKPADQTFKTKEEENLECLKSPYNIKVDFSTATGQRTYTLDEENRLPEIKHVANKEDNRPFRGGRSGRGQYRGRGRARGRQNRGGRGGGQRAKHNDPSYDKVDGKEVGEDEWLGDEVVQSASNSNDQSANNVEENYENVGKNDPSE